MAFATKCSSPTCKSTAFEVARLNFDNVPYPVEVVRCTSCGTVAGVLPSSQLSWMYEQMRTMFQKLGA